MAFELPPLSGPALALVVMIVGVLNCFYGYQWFKILVGFWGFLLGAALFGGAGFVLTANPLVGVIAGFLGGLFGMSLLLGVYFAAVFVAGFLFGGLLASVATAALLSVTGPALLLVGLAGAVVGGCLALSLQRVVLILATSFVGSFQLVAAGWAVYHEQDLRLLLDELPRTSPPPLLLGLWLVLGLIGCVFQFRGPPTDRPAEGRPE